MLFIYLWLGAAQHTCDIMNLRGGEGLGNWKYFQI